MERSKDKVASIRRGIFLFIFVNRKNRDSLQRPLGKYILFWLLIWIVFPLSAQNDAEQSSEPIVQDTLFSVRNAVKIDPVQIIFGDYRIYYERLISNHYSVEFGLGITRRNYTAGWFDYELDNLGDNIDILTRPSVSFSVRRYFEDYEELYGTYVALSGNYRVHAKDISVIDTTGSVVGEPFRDERRTLSLIFKIGYQALPLSSNVFADFYTGPAIRFKDYEIVKTGSINDPANYYTEDLDEVVFGWEVGVRIGFGF
jgi:hypothetical protein